MLISALQLMLFFFCEQWHLTVNHKKTNVLILVFSRKRHKTISERKHTLNNENLDIAEEFTNLGVRISATGNFEIYLTEGKEKTLQAFVKDQF